MYPLPNLFSSRFHDLVTEFDRLSRTVDQRSPAVPLNIWSDDDAVAVTVEVPGIARADLGIEATADTLTISGERKAAVEPTTTSILRERAYGRFSRTVTLPWRIDPERVEARLANGVLSVVLRRAESDKPRRIAVAA